MEIKERKNKTKFVYVYINWEQCSKSVNVVYYILFEMYFSVILIH